MTIHTTWLYEVDTVRPQGDEIGIDEALLAAIGLSVAIERATATTALRRNTRLNLEPWKVWCTAALLSSSNVNVRTLYLRGNRFVFDGLAHDVAS